MAIAPWIIRNTRVTFAIEVCQLNGTLRLETSIPRIAIEAIEMNTTMPKPRITENGIPDVSAITR